jgi:hypothetical protein
MERGLTVAELARAVAGPDGEGELVNRRIRHWTLAGALIPAGPAHAGTGRHHRYDSSAAYQAALLNWMADYSLSIAVLVAVGTRLRVMLAGEQRLTALWNDAIAGARDVWLLLVIGKISQHADQPPIELDLKTAPGMADWVVTANAGVVVRLTHLFGGVAL